jgi:methylglyoxal/glyoxal reductase
MDIPRVCLGVYQSLPGRTTNRAVKYALNIGYRHIYTASIYGNEVDVAKSIRERDKNHQLHLELIKSKI